MENNGFERTKEDLLKIQAGRRVAERLLALKKRFSGGASASTPRQPTRSGKQKIPALDLGAEAGTAQAPEQDTAPCAVSRQSDLPLREAERAEPISAAHRGGRAERPPAAQWRSVREPSRGQGYPSRLGNVQLSDVSRRGDGAGHRKEALCEVERAEPIMAAHHGKRAERPPAAQWRLVGEPSRGQGYPSRLGLDTASKIPRRRRGQGPPDYHCNVLRPDGQPDYRFNVLRPEEQRTPAAAKLAPGGRLGSPAGLYIDCVPDGVLLRALVDTGSTVSHGLWNCEPLIARQKGRMGVDTHSQLGSPMSSTGCGWQGGHEFCPTGTVLRLHSRTPAALRQ
ncbi:uncharacterized protein Hap1MRO34_014046 [Clarias gariepinus]